MSLVKWSPMEEMEEMRREMAGLFEEFFEPSRRRRRSWPGPSETGVLVPIIEMSDRKTEIVLKAELPGAEKDDIDLAITKDTVTIKGEIRREEEVEDEVYSISERSYGSFNRTLALPAEVESEKAKASFRNGILEVVLPKKEKAKPKEIKIQVS